MRSTDLNFSVNSGFERLKDTFSRGQTLPQAHRKLLLSQLRQFLSECEAEICEALKADLGKPRFESLTSEIGVLRVEIRHALAKLNGWMRPKHVSTPIAQFLSSSSYRYEPKGVVLIIGPWNFPLQLTLAPLIGAIAAGNTAIIKPSELAPHISNLLAKKLPQYLDSNCVSVVEGDHETSHKLLQMPFGHIFFTGSTNIGRIILKEAANNLIPVTLELGGKSPCVIDYGIDLNLAAKRIIWGKLMNCGQVCLAPDYVLVPKTLRESLVTALKAEIFRAYGKDPKLSDDYGRIVSGKHTLRLQGLIQGQPVIHGGQVDLESKYVAPTLVLNPELNSPLMQEEIFGPILPIIEFDTFDDVINLINEREKPLALYLFSHDKKQITRLQSDTASGALVINDTVSHVAVPDLPFGGVGSSGMGAYHGRDSFETFSYKRAFFKKSTLIDLPLRYAPFSRFYERIAGYFLR